MLGMNRRVSISQTERTITFTGSVGEETESVIATGVPAAIQANVLSHLPPPSDRPTQAGIYYLREFRCWIPKAAIPGITPHTQWIIKDERTNEKFRMRGIIDDAGRDHHWLLRLENYDG